MLTTGQASFVAFSRMDLVCLLENGFNDIPVMFAKDRDLRAWCEQNSLSIESVGHIPVDQALITRGNYNKQQGLYCDFLWVKASNKKYRDAMKIQWAARKHDKELPGDLHVDHIVNRASIRNLVKNGIDPWLMTFVVPWGANTGFGREVESRFDQFLTSTTRVDIDGLRLFKLYATDFPRNPTELDTILKNISGQINREWFNKIKTAIDPYVQFSGQPG